MVAHAQSKNWKKGDYKNLNLPFENKLLAQPKEIRDRMVKEVETFAYKMMIEVFNSQNTAPLAIEAMLKAGSYDLGPKVTRMEDPAEWTENKIIERASRLGSDKGSAGKFDD
jgi:fructose-bisphosphate aldolase class II